MVSLFAIVDLCVVTSVRLQSCGWRCWVYVVGSVGLSFAEIMG